MADLAITASAVLKSSAGLATNLIAAVAITQGQVLYQLAGTNTVGLADSNGTTPANTVAGIALNAASAGQPVTVVSTDTAFVPGATLTSGTTIYLSDTPGAITATYADLASGSTVIQLGNATSTTAMVLAPVVGGVK